MKLEMPNFKQIKVIRGTKDLTQKQKKALTAFEKDFGKLINLHFKKAKTGKKCNEEELQMSGRITIGFQQFQPQEYKIVARSYSMSTGGFNAMSNAINFANLLQQATEGKSPEEERAFVEKILGATTMPAKVNRPEIL